MELEEVLKEFYRLKELYNYINAGLSRGTTLEYEKKMRLGVFKFILEKMQFEKDFIEKICIIHETFDHLGPEANNKALQNFDGEIAVEIPKSPKNVATNLRNQLDKGNFDMEVYHTVGHTIGQIERIENGKNPYQFLLKK